MRHDKQAYIHRRKPRRMKGLIAIFCISGIICAKPRLVQGLILLLLVFLSYGCAVNPPHVCVKDGRDYADIGDKTVIYDWDSCFRRGVSYVNGGCPDYAIEQFLMAIEDRPDDTLFARPYGMHILGRFPHRERDVMGYFPHRELGILYYKKGRTAEAVRELEQSLGYCSSSKAMFYLNEARKAWLLENNLDRESPWIRISNPPSLSYLTNQLCLTLEGLAEDDCYVSNILVNEDPIFIELAQEKVPFTYTLSLQEGKNLIPIKTGDLAGRTTEIILEVTVDRMGPLINLTHSPVESALRDGWISIQGIVFDDSGVESLTINGIPLYFGSDAIAEFSQWIEVPEGIERISLAARDSAGNETLGHIDLSSGDGPMRMLGRYAGEGKLEEKRKECLMVLGRYPGEGPDAGICLQKMKGHEARLASMEPTLVALAKPFYLYVEPLPTATSYKQVSVFGDIIYKTAIAEITVVVNGRPIDCLPYAGLMDRIKDRLVQGIVNKLYFGWPVLLERGQNEIVIEVTDVNGQVQSQSLQVLMIEETAEMVRDIKYRMPVFLLDVDDISGALSGNPATDMDAFVELSAAFVEQGRFRVLDRKRLAEILREHYLSESVIADKKNAVTIGKLVRAEGMLEGFVTKTDESIELKGFMVDVDSSAVLCYKDIYLTKDVTGEINSTMARAARILAMKIRNDFPLCTGRVLEKKGDVITVDIGHKQKSCNTKLIVYRKNLILSEAKIDEADEHTSSASLLDKEKKDEVVIEDLVITK